MRRCGCRPVKWLQVGNLFSEFFGVANFSGSLGRTLSAGNGRSFASMNGRPSNRRVTSLAWAEGERDAAFRPGPRRKGGAGLQNAV